MDEGALLSAFEEKINAEIKIEPRDWMPDVLQLREKDAP